MINKLFSLIIKYSSDGDILDSFTVLTQDNPYMFLSVSFTVLKTESIILSAVTGVSGSNGIGVSESSSTDVTLIKINNKRNINWISSLDWDFSPDDSPWMINYNKNGVSSILWI